VGWFVFVLTQSTFSHSQRILTRIRHLEPYYYSGGYVWTIATQNSKRELAKVPYASPIAAGTHPSCLLSNENLETFIGGPELIAFTCRNLSNNVITLYSFGIIDLNVTSPTTALDSFNCGNASGANCAVHLLRIVGNQVVYVFSNSSSSSSVRSTQPGQVQTLANLPATELSPIVSSYAALNDFQRFQEYPNTSTSRFRAFFLSISFFP
jgi:hypothetical protein